MTDEHGHFGGAFDLDFQVSWYCMRKQINMALMRPVKVKNLGTTKLPCGFFKEPGDNLSSSFVADTGEEGDWDVNVRDLLRVVYLDSSITQPLLDTPTGIISSTI